MGLFRGAVFRHGGGARKRPIKQPTEMPTNTMALMGRFPSSIGRFPTLTGRFPDFALRDRFASGKSTGKQPIKERGIARFLSGVYNLTPEQLFETHCLSLCRVYVLCRTCAKISLATPQKIVLMPTSIPPCDPWCRSEARGTTLYSLLEPLTDSLINTAHIV